MAFLIDGTATAQLRCPDAAQPQAMAGCLLRIHGELPIFTGRGHSGRLYTLFANVEEGTWSITITVPGGLSTLVSAGGGYALPFGRDHGVLVRMDAA